MEPTKNSILIVEDDFLSIRALSEILRHDYTIYVEKKSSRVCDLAKRILPDLILLDIMMPDMSGYEVINELKRGEETSDIPVIFVTGMTNSEDEAKGLACGAVDYINKPFKESVVRMRVQHQIKIVNLIRKLQNLSTTDELTGVGNRRYFLTSVQHEWERAKREQTPMGVMMLDLDYFKKLNDTYGHITGDEVLVHVAQTIKSGLKRATDKIARWGGEEFAIIQPNTTFAGVRKIAEDIRIAVEKSRFPMEGQDPISLTTSIGVHCVTPNPDDEYTADDLIAAADRALYRAKQMGRNRVCYHNEPD
ncbi:MAG: diguanylate cyclase [Oscillospiraceae bacterium]|nr:diguanylate cyclase [Oscillospiraceae bacterium]MCL2279966.1 diguanylate cyclase [Oscillospiraceae bacterium]